jgi:release factor glutamine methyltransferase
LADSPTWRSLLDEATSRVGDRVDARRIVEEASGLDIAHALDEAPSARMLAHFDAMLERRANGEPLQYVLGRWGFRKLDVMVDRRVLIPRPETEIVVEHALSVIDALDAKVVVDLGTGSGVIALSLALERSALTVWATDVSDDALDVARANLAGVGRAATRVRLMRGEWFGALPDELRGAIDVVVSNPPYIAADETLPAEVRDWEPHGALVAGPTGLEAIETILEEAPRWLSPRGAVVLEIGETQAAAALEPARGYVADVRPDLSGRPRVLVGLRLP